MIIIGIQFFALYIVFVLQGTGSYRFDGFINADKEAFDYRRDLLAKMLGVDRRSKRNRKRYLKSYRYDLEPETEQVLWRRSS